MMTKSLYILILSGIALAMLSCSDDNTVSIGDPSSQSCDNIECDDGKYCYQGKCKKPLSEGKKCLDEVPCKDGLKCIDGYCATEDPEKKPEKDPEKLPCDGTCSDDQQCIEDKCVGVIKTGEDCDETSACESGTRCLNGKCTAWRKPGESCDWSDEEACDESVSVCNDDMICQQFPKKGEACLGIMAIYCETPLSCVDDVCVAYAGAGETCSEFDLCKTGYKCDAGICKTEVGNGQSCADSSQVCSDGLVCQDGVCIKSYGECQTNSDCNADSYCCLMDSCSTKNICFPYGEGPGGTYDPECKYKLVPGQFEASIQCEWLGNPSDGVEPYSNQIMSTIMVADLPFDSHGASELVAVTFGNSSVIRIFNGETCELLQSIRTNYAEATGNLALADLDNDGKIEIVSGNRGVHSWHWSDASQKYVEYWSNTQSWTLGWGGPSVHDINDDGYPEILASTFVLDGRTGAFLNTSSPANATDISIAGDVDGDGNIELVGQRLMRWNKSLNTWSVVSPSFTFSNNGMSQVAYADFGTENGSGFDFSQKDGIAEIVILGGHGTISLMSLSGKTLMDTTIPGTYDMWASSGGPANIGDFDGDGMPEIGVAGNNSYTVFDPRCNGVDHKNCQGQYYLWTSISQDQSSGVTGSSTFDFDSDGRTEVVYGDECYTRVYDGETGDVLFSSYRTSNTAYENPTIADVDHDMSAEIVIGSDSIAPSCPQIDPNHHGIRCTENADCFSLKCSQGYCRCDSDSQCNSQYDANGQLLDEYSCTTPLSPESISDGKVCRAKHPNGIKRPGFRVLRDRLDRWASTRFIWNQHAYSVTNINDDGTVPKTSDWKMNIQDPELNNFRQAAQGKISAGYAPDITGRLDADNACIKNKDQIIHIGGTLCNRGTKDVGSKLPATFYLGDPADNNILCTSYTDSNVVAGECRRVECEVKDLVSGTITMVVNDNGKGGRTTVECDTENNRDSIELSECVIEIN